ncbi:MAG: hypothetical protein FJ087_13180 [Deltaproteobacteria bacterium]|nr:hypothetical protein [Deltaproteobacteria bacterium]
MPPLEWKEKGSYEWGLSCYLDEPGSDLAGCFADFVQDVLMEAVCEEINPLFVALGVDPDDPEQAPLEPVSFNPDPTHAQIGVSSWIEGVGVFDVCLEFTALPAGQAGVELVARYDADGWEPATVRRIRAALFHEVGRKAQFRLEEGEESLALTTPFAAPSQALYRMAADMTAAFARAFQTVLGTNEDTAGDGRPGR